jgi:hypothetical protein
MSEFFSHLENRRTHINIQRMQHQQQIQIFDNMLLSHQIITGRTNGYLVRASSSRRSQR